MFELRREKKLRVKWFFFLNRLGTDGSKWAVLYGYPQFLRCATSRTVPGSIPGGVTWDFFPWFLPTKTMCPEVDSAFENEYQGFLLG